jgi:hypothetical protein
MSIWTAIGSNIVGPRDDEHRTARTIRLCDAPKEGGRETEGGRDIGRVAGRNFVKRPERQPPLRQVCVKIAKTERKRGCFNRSSIRLRQHPAKILHGFFAAWRGGFGI